MGRWWPLCICPPRCFLRRTVRFWRGRPSPRFSAFRLRRSCTSRHSKSREALSTDWVSRSPATLFPSPNSAVLAGAALTALLCFSASAFLHFAPFKIARGPVDGLAFLTAGFLMCYLEPLKYSCFNIHADGPGLAFGALACAALYSGGPEKWRGALPVSALCSVLSIFCKQTFLPVPIALMVYLWPSEGRARAVRYLFWLVAAGGLACAAALFAEGPERLYHCLIWLPAHHPWNDRSRIVSAIQAMRSFIRIGRSEEHTSEL